MNDNGARQSPAVTSLSSGADITSPRGHIPPTLIVAFEFERTPRALNAGDLTDDELVRVVDWIGSHTGWRTGLGEWLNRVLACREEWA